MTKGKKQDDIHNTFLYKNKDKLQVEQEDMNKHLRMLPGGEEISEDMEQETKWHSPGTAASNPLHSHAPTPCIIYLF